MAGTIKTLASTEKHFVLGETLRPLLTNAMGSSIEVFDTAGPADAGPPEHTHGWEEIYVVLSGELEVILDGEPKRIRAGDAAHIPAGVKHGYRNVTDAHFLTIVTRGNAAKMFAQMAAEVEMNPPDLPGVVRVAAGHGVEFVP